MFVAMIGCCIARAHRSASSSSRSCLAKCAMSSGCVRSASVVPVKDGQVSTSRTKAFRCRRQNTYPLRGTSQSGVSRTRTRRRHDVPVQATHQVSIVASKHSLPFICPPSFSPLLFLVACPISPLSSHISTPASISLLTYLKVRQPHASPCPQHELRHLNHPVLVHIKQLIHLSSDFLSLLRRHILCTLVVQPIELPDFVRRPPA